MSEKIIASSWFKRGAMCILGLFIVSGVLAAIVLYQSSQVSLNHHYGALHVTVTRVKETLIIQTIKINFLFYLLTVVGTVFIGILYSHKVAGPLFKVKQYAARLGQMRFEERICFRKKDAVKALSEVLNDVAEKCRKDSWWFSTNLKSLEDGLSSLEEMPGASKERTERLENLLELNSRISEEFRKLTL